MFNRLGKRSELDGNDYNYSGINENSLSKRVFEAKERMYLDIISDYERALKEIVSISRELEKSGNEFDDNDNLLHANQIDMNDLYSVGNYLGSIVKRVRNCIGSNVPFHSSDVNSDLRDKKTRFNPIKIKWNKVEGMK